MILPKMKRWFYALIIDALSPPIKMSSISQAYAWASSHYHIDFKK